MTHMHGLVLVWLSSGCGGDTQPATFDLVRGDTAGPCEVREALRGAPPSDAYPERRSQTSTLLDQRPELLELRAIWHGAAACRTVRPPVDGVDDASDAFLAHAWLVEDAIDQARAGRTEPALAQMMDLWRVTEALQLGPATDHLIGMAMQHRLLVEVGGPWFSMEQRQRWARDAGSRVAVPLSIILDLERRAEDSAPWSQQGSVATACLGLDDRVRAERMRVESVPAAERADAWTRAFSDLPAGGCPRIEVERVLLEKRAAVETKLRRLAATGALDGPR